MVIQALRRQVPDLQDASLEEISEYLAPMSEAQMLGLINAVKGVYHEIAFVAAENSDGDSVTAEVFGETNHPGADVILTQGGETVQELQLKAIQGVSEYYTHLARYPDIEVRVTEEVARLLEDESLSSGFLNQALAQDVKDTLNDVRDETAAETAAVALAGSAVVGAALSARKLLRQGTLDTAEAKQLLADMGVGVGTALTIDALIDLI